MKHNQKISTGTLGQVMVGVTPTTPGVAKIVAVDDLGNIQVAYGDGPSVDAFGRARVSDTGQRLDVEFLYNKQEEFFDEITNNGTVTYNGNTRDLTLSLSDANNGSYATMRSHPVPYTPGNSQLIDITGVLDLADIGDGTAEYFLRTSISGTVAETSVEQSSWNNLSGSSDIDWSKSHIFSMDFQSLKVGRIRFFIVDDGVPYDVGSIKNNNIRSSGYWQLASLPAYWRIYNTASYTIMEVGYGDEANAIGFRYKVSPNAAATMKAICCTVKSEGGLNLKDIQGLPRSIDSGVTAKTVSTSLIPLISIRPRSTFATYPNMAIALPKSFNLTATNAIRLVVVHDVTLTGASWVNVDTTDSMMEYDVTASAYSNGHIVYSEYVSTTSNNRATANQGLLGKTVLWNRGGAHTGIVTIAAIRTGSNDASCLTSIQWEEIW